jgi:hypothetical protein
MKKLERDPTPPGARPRQNGIPCSPAAGARLGLTPDRALPRRLLRGAVLGSALAATAASASPARPLLRTLAVHPRGLKFPPLMGAMGAAAHATGHCVAGWFMEIKADKGRHFLLKNTADSVIRPLPTWLRADRHPLRTQG